MQASEPTEMATIFSYLGIATTIVSASAFAQVHGHLVDSSGQPVRTGSGDCIRTGSWAADKPTKGCDFVPDPARVILLPEPDGSVGTVSVTTATGEHLLNTAYAGVEVENGRSTNVQESAHSVQARYGNLLQGLPPRITTYVVHFAKGSSSELSEESLPVIEKMKAELTQRPFPEITIIGHTDSVGKLEANDALSLKRAKSVQDILSRSGVRAASMAVVGRGERELLVPTADEVSEPRNRRVEISVR